MGSSLDVWSTEDESAADRTPAWPVMVDDEGEIEDEDFFDDEEEEGGESSCSWAGRRCCCRC